MSNHSNARKIVLDLAVSLDGFIEGPNGEVDWCIMDDDMGFTDFLDRIDTILYGRKSYDLWGQYIPAPEAANEEKVVWSKVHAKEKIVFSRTTKRADDQVRFIMDHIPEEIAKLKNRPGKDIWLYGGSSLITTFIELGLIDEFRLSVHPVVLGEGKPLFIDIKQKLDLELIEANRFSSGVVQLIYRLHRK